MEANETRLILEVNTSTGNVSSEPGYDVYRLVSDEFRSFDDLDFVETLSELPVAWKYTDPTEEARWVYDEADAESIAGEDNGLLVWVRRINEGEPANADYSATYEVRRS